MKELELDQIYNLDCLDGMKHIPDGSIDLVVTSPPYDNLRTYNGYCFDFEGVAKELYRVVKDGGVVVWVVGDATIDGDETGTSFRQALYFKEIGFKLFDTMIYEKAGTDAPHPNRYFNVFEYMFVFSKGKIGTTNILKDKKNTWAGTTSFGCRTVREKDGSLTPKGVATVQEFGVRGNIWRYANGKGFSTKDDVAFEHPAIFPEQLVSDHIRSWSNEGDLVLDPFMGSGTTAKVAHLLSRHYIGFEISEEYCKIIRQRLNEHRSLF